MPTTLSRALEGVLDGFATAPLRSATAELVAAYRSGAPPAGLVLADPIRAAAYAAYRMPATHAAVSRALLHAVRADPGLDVRSVLDVGGGTGAASWAAAETLGTVERIEVLDASAPALELGRRLARQGPPAVAGATWTQARLDERIRTSSCDLAVVSYVLGELEEAVQRSVVDALAPASPFLLLVVEPGTPRGYAAVLAARSQLVEAGWHVLVPCPQDGPCPLAGSGDWCHFSARLDRSALHRRLKGAALGHEDEKFSYVLASRNPVHPTPARVLRHPVRRKGLVQLEVCRPDGTAGRQVVTRRGRDAYRTARDLAWGDALPPGPDDVGRENVRARRQGTQVGLPILRR